MNVKRLMLLVLVALLGTAACSGDDNDNSASNNDQNTDAHNNITPGSDANNNNNNDTNDTSHPDDQTDSDSTPADTGVAVSDEVEWIAIPGGVFTMGHEKLMWAHPPHQVTVSPFFMARTETTVAQYKKSVDAGVCPAPKNSSSSIPRNHEKPHGGPLPMDATSWNGAVAFCTWAGGRLPSEAEWECAARGGGQDIAYPWGDELPSCDRCVMKTKPFGDTPEDWGCGTGEMQPACSRPAGNTAQGLCDMAGNTWEWVQDIWQDTYDGAPTDGSAWEDASTEPKRVIRGGNLTSHHNYTANFLHVSARDRGGRPQDIGWGFRCARDSD